MTIFLVLSFVRWEGDPTFHLVVGTVCAMLFVKHICIHANWLKAVTKSYLAGKIKKAIKWKYTINVLLLAVWGITIITGFLAIIPYVSGAGSSVWGWVHGRFARLGLLLIIIHVIQHRNNIFSYFKTKRSNQPRVVEKKKSSAILHHKGGSSEKENNFDNINHNVKNRSFICV
jgi:hypothetical protein